jgi:hypothetical protein
MKIRTLAAAATIGMALVAQVQAMEIYSFYFTDDTTGARVDGLIYGLSYNSAPDATPNFHWERASSVVITSLPDPFNGLGSLTVPFTVREFTNELFDGVIYHNRWLVHNGEITYAWYQTEAGYFDINCEAVPGVNVNSIQAPPYIPFNPTPGQPPVPVVDRGVIYNTGGLGPNGIHFARVTEVPEPASWTLVVLGFSGLGAVLRRRRKSTVVA